MNDMDFSGLTSAVPNKIAPFVQEVLAARKPEVHSIHIVGSAVTPDYHEKRSDINSVVVLNEFDLGFIEFLAPLGRKYGKKGIAAPLVMTPQYIRNSLDAFPVEFLEFKLIHRTVYGEDILAGIELSRPHLRLQCEREIKTKLIGLRQGYLSSLGKRSLLAPVLVRSFTGSLPLFRAIIHLLGKKPPVARPDVLTVLGAAAGFGTTVFEQLLHLKAGRIKPSEQELRSLFETYYTALESLGKIVDELRV